MKVTDLLQETQDLLEGLGFCHPVIEEEVSNCLEEATSETHFRELVRDNMQTISDELLEIKKTFKEIN